jgi:hypothetical protein
MSIPGSVNPLFLGAAGQATGEGGYLIERSLRFNSPDSAYLSRTPASAGNRKTWTWAGWLKKSADGGIFESYTSGATLTSIRFLSNTIELVTLVGGAYTGIGMRVGTTAVFRDHSAWYHLVLAFDTTQAAVTDAVKIYINGVQQVVSLKSGAYTQNSDHYINFTYAHQIGTYNNDSYLSGYLADIHFIDGQALDPTSFGEFDATTGVWNPKAYSGDSYGTNGFHLEFADNSSNTATTLGKDTSPNGNNWTPNNLSVTAGAISAPSRFTWSTTGSGWTLSNSNYTASYTRSNTYTQAYSVALDGSTTYRFYLRQTPGDNVGGWFFAGTNSVSNTHPDELGGDSLGMRNGKSTIGTYGSFATANGTSSGVDQITGLSSITASSGSTTYSEWVVNMTARKVWVRSASDSTWIKGGDPSNSSSTPTFYLASGTVYFGYVGYDGTGTVSFDTFVPSIAAGNDSLVDVPVNGAQTDTGAGGQVRGNYATLNPLDINAITLSNGNLDAGSTGETWKSTRSSIAVTSGKWYCEFTATGGNTPYDCQIGIVGSSLAIASFGEWSTASPAVIYNAGNGNKYINGASTAYGASYTINDVIGVAFDADTMKVTFYKNGVSQSEITTGLSAGSYSIALALYGRGGGTTSATVNFGQRTFAYQAPEGFKALNTANLPSPQVTKPSDLFDVKLYTGNGSTQTISGLGFSPDLVWIKERSSTSSHQLYDTIRGATNTLYSNSSNEEQVNANALTSFTSAGFNVGVDNNVNQDTQTYVAWTWDAGSSTVTNTQGSISSQVRANASAGFSIVTYTGNATAGATVGHGLGVAPSMIIVKNRSVTASWQVGHVSPGWTQGAYLSATDSFSPLTTFWNDTAPSSSVFTLGTLSFGNGNGNNLVAYCFAPVAGYSAFGSYTGNGSADGPFVFCNFRPRWILQKQSSADGFNWAIRDTARDVDNPNDARLFADTSSAESVNDNIDILSNGFKIRNSVGDWNASGATYVWAAFAENPFALNARAR